MSSTLPEGFVLETTRTSTPVGPSLPEGFVLEQAAPSVYDSIDRIQEPVNMLQGIEAKQLQKIRDIVTSEEESRSRVADYIARAMGAPYDAVRNDYELYAQAYGFEGESGTNHYTTLVQRSAQQWQHIKETEKRLGRDFQGTLLQRAIPLVRADVEILSGNKPVEEHVKGLFLGSASMAASVMSGFAEGGGSVAGAVKGKTLPFGQEVPDFTAPFTAAAQWWGEQSKNLVTYADVPPSVREAVSYRVAEGLGSLGVSAVSFITNPAVGTSVMSAAMFDEGVTRYDELVPEAERNNADRTAMGVIQAGVGGLLERIGMGKLTKPLFAGAKGLSLRQVANRAQQFTVGTVTETSLELLQTMLLNAQSMAIDPDAELFDELTFDDVLVTTLVSAFGAGSFTSLGLAQDVEISFRRSPVTQDGSAPLAPQVRAMVERHGVEYVQDLHEEGDPRRDLVLALASDNPQEAQQAEQQYLALTIPKIEERATIIIPREEAQQRQEPEDVIDVEEVFLLLEERNYATPEERALFEAELQEELQGMQDVDLIAEEDILMGGKVPDVDLTRAESTLFEEEMRRSLGMSRMPAEQYQSLKLKVQGDRQKRIAREQGQRAVRREEERAFKIQNALERRVEALRTRLDQTRARGAADLAQTRLRASEAVQAERIKRARSEQKIREQAAKRFAKEVEKRLREVERRFAERKNLKQSIAELKDLTNMLPRAVRGDLNSYFKTISTKVSPEAQARVLDKAFQAILDKVESYRRQTLRANFRTEQAKAEKEIKAALAAQKRPSRVLLDIKTYLEERGLLGGEARSIIETQYAALNARIEQAEAREEVYQITESDEELMRQSMLPDLSRNDLSSYEYEQAIEDLKTLREEGKTAWEKQKAKEELRVKTLRAVIQKEIEDRLNEKNKPSLDEDSVDSFARRLSLLSGAKFSLLDYRSVSAILTGKRNNSRIKTYLFDKISEGVSTSMVEHESYVRFVQSIERRHGVSAEQLGSQDLVEVGSRFINAHEAMFIYGHSQNLEGQRHLANTKVGGVFLRGEQVERVIAAMPENHKAFVDDLIGYNDTIMYPRMNELFRRLYGVDMPKVQRYLPLSSLNHGDAFQNILGEAFRIASTASSFLKARQKSKLGFRSLDLIGSLYRHNQAAEHTLAMRELLTTIQGVLRDKKLQSTIRSVEPRALEWMNEFLRDVGRGKMPPPNSDFVALHRMLRNNVRAFWIAFNPASWMKTQAPIISAAQDVGKGALLSTAMRPWNAMSNWQEAKSKSKFMASRKQTARIEIMEIAQLREYAESKARLQGLKDWSLAKLAKLSSRAQNSAYWVYTPLDLASTSMVWVAKYRDGLSTHGNEAKAIRDADEVVKVHFPSGRIEEMPALFRSGGMEKELTVFTADMNRMLNLGYSKSQLSDGKIKEAITFAVYSVLLASVYLAATDVPWDAFREALGLKDEEDDREERMMKDAARYMTSQVAGGIPGIGALTEASVAKLIGDQQMGGIIMRQTPIYFYPATQIYYGNYVTAGTAAAGIPVGNIFAPLIDDYLQDED